MFNIKYWGWLILFTSTSTLLCCALPIVLVSLGFGAVVASVYGEYLPILGLLGLYKNWTFSISAIILMIAGWLLYRPARACPKDLKFAKACVSANQWNKYLYWISVLIWCVGFVTAYLYIYV